MTVRRDVQPFLRSTALDAVLREWASSSNRLAIVPFQPALYHVTAIAFSCALNSFPEYPLRLLLFTTTHIQVSDDHHLVEIL